MKTDLLIFVALSFSILVVSACAGSPTRVRDGVRGDLSESGPEIGPLEEEARYHLEVITDLLGAQNQDPQDTVVSIGRYLDQNQEAIRANAAAIAERVAAMSDSERIYYEERFAVYFGPANQQWRQTLGSFREAHPRAASRVDGLMLLID